MPTMMGVIFYWKIALLCNFLKCQYSITVKKILFGDESKKNYLFAK